jgi:hypothetical protein
LTQTVGFKIPAFQQNLLAAIREIRREISSPCFLSHFEKFKVVQTNSK